MPRVSIALPVYNGEPYVGAAVESLLAQTLTDFELVILDNASTDRTSEICRALAARDRRIRYHRNEVNIGGGPNMVLGFELASSAPYFKWSAHDDLHGPRFLETCVDLLDRDPTAVLAFTRAELVDDQGKTLAPRVGPKNLDSPDVAARFAAILPGYDCLDMFAVIRREAMIERPILGTYADSDGVLLARLVLRGRFCEVPELQFYNRRHATQAGSTYDGAAREWSNWWSPENAQRRVFPQWRRQLELWRSLARAKISTGHRLRCATALAQWTVWKRDRLYDDVEFHVKDLYRSLTKAEK